MRSLRRFLTRLLNLVLRRRGDARLKEEIAEHIAMQTVENIRAGMAPAKARRQAVLKFGAVEAITESYRSERGMPLVATIAQDLRYAVRLLAKSPGFAAVAILTLALGIGANTAIFSVIDAVVFTPLPAEAPQDLVVLNWTANHEPKFHGHSDYGDCGRDVDCSLSVPFYKSVRAQSHAFSGVAAFAGPVQFDISGNGPATMAQGEYVSGDFFATVGVKMELGRPLSPADDQPSSKPAIVLNYGYWQRAFAGDRSVIGRTLRINNTEAEIVGVAGRRYLHITPGKIQDFCMPLSLASRVRSEWWRSDDRLGDPDLFWVVVIGRLKPGVSAAQAQAEATGIFRNQVLRGATPMLAESDAPAIHLMTARDGLDGETRQLAPLLALVLIAVAFILLIACGNVAGLILARSAKRQKELAVRQALGARRGRIARQLLTESVVLSTAGGLLGVAIAIWSVHGLTSMVSNEMQQDFPFPITPDWRVFAFTSAVTLVTGILAGLAPALQSAGADLTPSLRENAPSAPGETRGRIVRLGDALVVGQVALSIVVLVGAGLLVRSLFNLQSTDPGFDTRNVLLFGINPTIAGYKDSQTMALYELLQRRLAALPGVLSVSYSEDALLSGSWSAESVHLDGAPPKDEFNTATLTIGPDFFSTMHIPLLAGRAFVSSDYASAATIDAAKTAADEAAAKASGGSPAAAGKPQQPSLPLMPVLINQTFARKAFPNQNPVGRHIDIGRNDQPESIQLAGYRVAGVVGDTKYDNLRKEIKPTMYLPLTGNSAHFELRSAGDPRTLTGLVRNTVSAADSRLPLFDVRTQTDQIAETLFHERMLARLSIFFAILALALASIGLYGLLAFEVSRRTRELGIRMALGAQRRNLMRTVLRRGMFLALFGALIGSAAAAAATRLMKNMLYELSPGDPATFGGVVVVLALVALAASYLPARRAMRVDPITALRHE